MIELTTTHIQVVAAKGLESIEQTYHFKATCNGPKCGKPDSACKSILEWSESTDKNKSNIPDEFYRLINFKVGPGEPMDFFSRECLRDYLRGWTPPFSPRELAAIAANNECVQKVDEVISTPAVYTNPDSDATGVK